MSIGESTMRCAVLSVFAFFVLLVTVVPSLACPTGYAPCGKFCCPK